MKETRKKFPIREHLIGFTIACSLRINIIIDIIIIIIIDIIIIIIIIVIVIIIIGFFLLISHDSREKKVLSVCVDVCVCFFGVTEIIL